jgi:peptidoglycan/xylan/chitin deacetylase (PgdA/CDA1 family)
MITFASVLLVGMAAFVSAGAAYVLPQARQARAVLRLRNLARRRRMVCLTYDDGPGPILTAQLLDLLRAAGVPATFYLLGRRAVLAPDLPARAVAEGHEVGAHSMWHRHAWKSTPWGAYMDVQAGYAALASWVGPSGRFRPPYGKVNLGSWLAIACRGAPIDWWTIDSGDTWDHPPSPEQVAERVVQAGGGVVLLHDFDRDAVDGKRSQYVLQTTDAVIAYARRAGLVFGTMSDLEHEPASL